MVKVDRRLLGRIMISLCVLLVVCPGTLFFDGFHQVYAHVVIEPDGISDVFCRNQYSGLTMLRHAAMWCVDVRKLKDARFYVGVMTSKGGRFHSISRNKAIEHIGQWVFENI